MDLPTYTNIWRIEKRLYKLYDFRLPMPLPINWIAVFAGITVPYIVLLVAIGLPFNHTLVWLYVLPPGLLTWLITRPVIENKRLPELLESQVRYLTEPRVWCRLGPLSEKDQTLVTALANCGPGISCHVTTPDHKNHGACNSYVHENIVAPREKVLHSAVHLALDALDIEVENRSDCHCDNAYHKIKYVAREHPSPSTASGDDFGWAKVPIDVEFAQWFNNQHRDDRYDQSLNYGCPDESRCPFALN